MFINAEEAWFWFMTCQQLRRDGSKPDGNGRGVVRPCDPDDIYRALMSLFRADRITTRHIRTLADYGLQQRAPDGRCREEAMDRIFWDQTLDLLTAVLRVKKIVQMPEEYRDDDV